MKLKHKETRLIDFVYLFNSIKIIIIEISPSKCIHCFILFFFTIKSYLFIIYYKKC